MSNIDDFEIQNGVLIRCNSIDTAVEIPDCVTSIGDNAFISCSNLTDIKIPKSVTSIGYRGFNCANLKNVYTEDLTSFINLQFGKSLGPRMAKYNLYIGDELAEDIVIPDCVTSIGDATFNNCSSLKSITIPDSVTAIGIEAFRDCSNLTSVTISQSVTIIADRAFCFCSSLKDIAIPEGVTIIGREAFSNCNNLTDVTIPNSMTRIGEEAFADCENLRNVYAGNVDNYLKINFEPRVWSEINLYFNGEPATDIIIPDGERSIGTNVFWNCNNLINLTIPASVDNIERDAFNNCRNLKNVYADDLIGFSNLHFGKALGWLTGTKYDLYIKGRLITDLIVPDGVTTIEEAAFYRCESLTSVTIPDSVVQIGAEAFSECCNLTSVAIPDSVTSIGRYAFCSCSSLKSILIPNSVMNIEGSAFSGCSSLTSVVIPNGITSINNYAFSRCSDLTSVTIPKSVTYIDNCAFRGCSSLPNITLPDSVKGIGWSVFEGCSALKSIIIPDSVIEFGGDEYSSDKRYGDFIFHSNTIVILSEYIKGIEKRDVAKIMVFRKTPIQDIKSTNAKVHAVKGFLAVDDLSIYDDKVLESYKKYLKGKAINYMDFILENDTAQIISKLASLGLLDSKFVGKMMEQDIPDEVKTILSEQTEKKQDNMDVSSERKAPSVSELKKYWSYAKNGIGVTITSYKDFDTEVAIPEKIGKDEVTEIGDEAFSPEKRGINDKQHDLRREITSVTIPNGVTSIGDRAFHDCRSLVKVAIPDSVLSIGTAAFSSCRSLETIVIPDQITNIGQTAFANCYNLKEIQIPYGLSIINRYTFSDCRSLSNITIPDSVTSIGAGAFSDCNSLTRIVIPDSVTSISEWAFDRCNDLMIYAPSGSFAEEYALKKNIPFTAL